MVGQHEHRGRLPEQVGAAGEADGTGGGDGQAAETVLLYGRTEAGDEAEKWAAVFLLKDSAPADIVAAIQAVHAGDGSLSPAIARRLIALVAGDPDTAARQEQARRRLASLTPP